MTTKSGSPKKMLTVRIQSDLQEKLFALVKATGRTQSFLVEEALETFCNLNAWQIVAINKGLEDVNAGHVISHSDIKQRWQQKRDHLLE
jgi:RHH-type transcriptional regulator, rel operon repressor / antitoxin RelB